MDRAKIIRLQLLFSNGSKIEYQTQPNQTVAKLKVSENLLVSTFHLA